MVSTSRSISLHGSLQLLNHSAMTTSEKLAPTKLKIKLSKVSSESEIVSAEVHLKSSGNNGSDYFTGVSQSHDVKARFLVNHERRITTTSGKEQAIATKIKLQRSNGDRSAHGEMVYSEKYNLQLSVRHGSKRGPVMGLDNQKAKKQKIDSKVLVQCAALLKKLMTHHFSWVFNIPVDPVALCIPDYFSVIAEPMDLGTIKSKVEKKLYSSPDEFAADVRLTFANAMLYNPPSNDVHKMAKELSGIFESRWKTLDAKRSAARPKLEQQLSYNQRSSVELESQSTINQRPSTKLEHEPNVNRRPSNTLDLRRDGYRTEGSCPTVSDGYIRSAESAHNQFTCGRDSLQKDLHRGNGNSSKHVVVSVSDKSRTSSVGINGSCESRSSRCSHHNEIQSDVDSSRSSVRDSDNACHATGRHLDLPVNGTDSRQTIKVDPDSDGGVGAADEESSRLSTPSTAAAASEEGWENNIYNDQLSPSKALRAAILRSRFADTIVKAQQKTLLSNGERSDPVKLKKEKERLERQQCEERARIEAKIRAAEAASRMKEEMESKKRREMEREAARIALEKMERTVEIYENMEILKDIEMLGGYSQPDCSLKENPLERLGLFIKDEYMEEEEEEFENCFPEVDLENFGDVEEPENCNDEQQPKNCDGEEPENCSGDALELENINGEELEPENCNGDALELENLNGEELEPENFNGDALELENLNGESLENLDEDVEEGEIAY